MAASEVLVGPVYQPDREENQHLLEFSLPRIHCEAFCSVSTQKKRHKKKAQEGASKKASVPNIYHAWTINLSQSHDTHSFPLIRYALFPQSPWICCIMWSYVLWQDPFPHLVKFHNYTIRKIIRLSRIRMSVFLEYLWLTAAKQKS